MRHGEKRCDANRIIEYVELNFNVNVVVNVSDRAKRFSIYSQYTEKSRRSVENNTASLSSPVTLIIKNTFYI